jgi:excisionase family DNA binding protein
MTDQRTPNESIFERITVKAYAAYKGVSQRTVRRWIRKNLVDCERTGDKGHWRIKVPRAS